MLIRRSALLEIGGIEAIKNSLIDDVALAAQVKKFGSIYLGHSGLAASIRPYPGFADIWQMISRTAFTQLRHSARLLALTLLALTTVWLVPVWEHSVRTWRAAGRGDRGLLSGGRQLCSHPEAVSPLVALGARPPADCAVLHGGDRGLGGELLARPRGRIGKSRAYDASHLE